jgi:hypothetical protein
VDQREFRFEEEKCFDRSAAETVVSPAKVTGAFERYRLAVPEQQVARMLLGRAPFSRQGPLSAWVVTWLMIFQPKNGS